MGCVVPSKTAVGVPAIKGDTMKIEELKALIDEASNDGEINHETLNKAINSNFDALIDVKVTKAKESSQATNIAEFIKGQGFENIDQFNAFVKNTKAASTELSEKVTRYESELEALRTENGSLKTTNDEYTYMGKLNNVDEKYKKFVFNEVKGLTDESTDFETAAEQYLANNVHYLRDNESIVTKIPKGQTKTEQSDGVLAILEDKHGIKLE